MGMLSMETWAFNDDTEASSNDSIKTGTLDLKTNNADGVTQTLYATGLKPNVSVGPSTITLMNTGTAAAARLDMAFNYVESDGSPNTDNMSADATAAIIEVTTLIYDGSSLLTGISDSNSNGYRDMQDIKNASLTGLSGLAAGASKDLTIVIKMCDGISNSFQADGISISMTFTLIQ